MSWTPTRKFRPRSMPFVLEELESRVCPTSVCDANPTYQAECDYLNNLIPASAITLTAVRSGAWSNPATWGGRLPGNGDNVWIPHGITVTVDTQETGALRSILDNGVLTFAPNVNTSLTVNTIVVGTDNNPTGQPQGELDIGTAAHPIQSGVTATILFADLGPQSQLFPNDPNLLSGGLISMGTLNIYGSQVTPWVDMSNAAAGATTLTLASQPVGWRVGDTLLLPGTTPTANQDEQIQIAAIQNNANGTTTITLASPLQYAHSAPNGQSVQVADENRSVVLESQDTTDHDGAAGQVMEMHNDACSVQYASLLNLGRTDKSVAIGSTLANGEVNVRGRYALHFHRDYWPSINGNDPPIQVVGNFEMGSPGWGYVNHSSNVDFIDNVAYNNFGAAFVTEAGNELGSFQNNLAIDTPGVPNSTNNLAFRQNVQDFGWNGAGFWLTSPSTTVLGNHVWEAQIGYGIYPLGLVQEALSTTKSWHGQPTNFVPLATFNGDTAGEVQLAIETQWAESNNNTISNFAAWDITNTGIALSKYDTHFSFVNVTLLGAAGSNIGIQDGLGYTFNVNVINADVEGFQIGYSCLDSTVGVIQGGYWNDATAIYFPNMSGFRQITISGPITFGPNVQTEYSMQQANLAAYVGYPGNATGAGFPNNIFQPDQILLPNGQELYALDRAANYVPFPTVGTNQPAAWIGLTNAQLWAQYGVAPGGAVAPSDAVTTSATNALIGSAQALPAQVATIVSPNFGQVGTPYVLQYALNPPGQVSHRHIHNVAAPFQLQPGWNALTESYNGTTYSWLVFGNIFNHNSVPAAVVNVAYNRTITAPPGYTLSLAITSGALPSGLTFTINGNVLTISGTATAAGSVTFDLTATDSNGNPTTQQFTLNVVTATNVSAQVSWSASAMRYDARTHTYIGSITLTNTGSTALSGRLLAVLTGLPSGVTLLSPTGTYSGNPYIQVTPPNGKLLAGQSVTFAVKFRDPAHVPITFGESTYLL